MHSAEHLVGFAATPSKQIFGFFDKNLVMEYGHERTVDDEVNVNYGVYQMAVYSRRCSRRR